MKKIFIAFELLSLSLLATSCTVDSNVTSSYQESSNQANMKEIDCGIEHVQGIDEANKTNISSFEEIPIVTDEMLSLGYQGGEGAQWPLCLTGDNKKGNLMFYGTDVGGFLNQQMVLIPGRKRIRGYTLREFVIFKLILIILKGSFLLELIVLIYLIQQEFI